MLVNGGGGWLFAPLHFVAIRTSLLLMNLAQFGVFFGVAAVTADGFFCPAFPSGIVGILPSSPIPFVLFLRKDPPILMNATILSLTLRRTLSLSALLSAKQTCLGPLRETILYWMYMSGKFYQAKHHNIHLMIFILLSLSHLPMTSAALNRYCSFVSDFNLVVSVVAGIVCNHV